MNGIISDNLLKETYTPCKYKTKYGYCERKKECVWCAREEDWEHRTLWVCHHQGRSKKDLYEKRR